MADRFEYGRMNTAELLDTVFELYKKTFWRQMVRAMIFGIPAYIALIAVSIFGAVLLNAAGSGKIFGGFAAILIVFVLLILIWDALSFGGNISLTKQAFYGKKVSLDVMFSDIRKNFIKMFSAVAAIFLLAFPPLAIAALFFSRVFRSVNFSSFPDISLTMFIAAAAVVVFIAYAATAVFDTLVSSAAASAAAEKKYFFSAVARSVRLIRGDFLTVCGTFMLWRLILGLLNYSVTAVYFLATGSFAAGVNFFAEFNARGALTDLIGNNFYFLLISLILSPLGGILKTVIYFNQRIKKEGFDIEIELGLG